MKLAELELRYRNDGWEEYSKYKGTGKNAKVLWCVNGFIEVMRRMFDFPKKPPKRVWLTLHSRPSMFREELQVHEWELTGSAILKKGKRPVCGDDATDKMLFPLIGKTVYLEVEYEE